MEDRETLAALGRRGVTAEEWREQAARLGGEAAARALACADRDAVQTDLQWLETSGTQLVHCESPRFPPLLAHIPRAPCVLYVRGSLQALSAMQLAMVGSRNPTASGRATAREFAEHFALAGLAITSGLALGIDAASHEGALAVRGITLGVCGTGLDAVYPREHAQLADAIVAGGGALVTEFPPGTPPLKHNFPRRNRLISGLAAGVLVVEAARGSGSLSTARHAGEQGRAVLAIPGSIHNPLTRGCHQLIREGAKLVETAADVLAELNISDMEQVVAPAKIHAGKTAKLDNECEILLDAVGFDPTSIDVLVERTGFSAELVASTLLILELDGHVEPHPGGRYGRALQA